MQLVISIGSQGRPSPTTSHSNAEVLGDELADYRSQLLAMARPPVNPTDCSQGGTMFTPLVGVPMEAGRTVGNRRGEKRDLWSPCWVVLFTCN